jgi:hypothetical protein
MRRHTVSTPSNIFAASSLVLTPVVGFSMVVIASKYRMKDGERHVRVGAMSDIMRLEKVAEEESARAMATLPPLRNIQRRAITKGSRYFIHRMTQERHVRQLLRLYELAYIFSHILVVHRLSVWRGAVIPKVESIDRTFHIA